MISWEGFVVVPAVPQHFRHKDGAASDIDACQPSKKRKIDVSGKEQSLGREERHVLAVASITVDELTSALRTYCAKAHRAPATLTVSEQAHSTAHGTSTCFTLHVSFEDPHGGVDYPRWVSVLSTEACLPVFYRHRPPAAPPVSAAPPSPHLEKTLLVVGAGGIGCELLKVLVLFGFRRLTVIDLDTIDATNLNRQFLFQPSDVGRPKALTARSAVLRWVERRARQFPLPSARLPSNPLHITAYHDNVKDEAKFGDNFFQGFSAVLSALDNVSARQHVNRMCMKARVPLFESGTMGYNGQVQPIVKGRFECYDCQPKPTGQQTFAVCTIHARPTTIVHCVHFAKELYETLFGERETLRYRLRLSGAECVATSGADRLQTDTDGELAYLRHIEREWMDAHRVDLLSQESLLSYAKALAKCLFHDKIADLLAIKSSWATQPPAPLEPSLLVQSAPATGRAQESSAAALPRDVLLSVEENVEQFYTAVSQCAVRLLSKTLGTTGQSISDHGDGETFSFKKEDNVAVDFVAATANLRAANFHIPRLSTEELRTVAGAIVPAIATTNAIVAAGVVQQLLAYYESCSSPDHTADCACMSVYVRKAPLLRRRLVREQPTIFVPEETRMASPRSRSPLPTARVVADRYLVHSVEPRGPAPGCLVCGCGVPTVVVRTVLRERTLGEFVQCLLCDELGMESPSVTWASKIIYEEEDYEELAGRLLSSFVEEASVPASAPADGTRGPEQHELVLLADALNKAVEWRIILKAPQAPTEERFSVEGLEAAKRTEILAQQHTKQENAMPASAHESGRADDSSLQTDQAKEPTASPAQVYEISDDESENAGKGADCEVIDID